MGTIPFKKFIIMFLLFNKNTTFIIDRLKSFGYYITEPEIVEILNEIRSILPPGLTELINSDTPFDILNEQHAQWLKHFGVFEFYDYLLRREIEKDPPPYFIWCADCLWIHSYKDIMCLVNILLFNNESIEEISDIIWFKYKKKVAQKCLDLYKDVFWNTDNMTAKAALEYCTPFKDNTMVIRKMRSGETAIGVSEEQTDSSDLPVVFQNTNYIKWKIGYNKIAAPTARDFLNQIKLDSYFKYYEAMNMDRSELSETESGVNEKIGSFSRTLVFKRNVEEQRVKMAKSWIDIYLKANEAMPENGSDTKNFFEKMDQLELDFSGIDSEKIARISDLPEMLDDIKGDLSP